MIAQKKVLKIQRQLIGIFYFNKQNLLQIGYYFRTKRPSRGKLQAEVENFNKENSALLIDKRGYFKNCLLFERLQKMEFINRNIDKNYFQIKQKTQRLPFPKKGRSKGAQNPSGQTGHLATGKGEEFLSAQNVERQLREMLKAQE